MSGYAHMKLAYWRERQLHDLNLQSMGLVHTWLRLVHYIAVHMHWPDGHWSPIPTNNDSLLEAITTTDSKRIVGNVRVAIADLVHVQLAISVERSGMSDEYVVHVGHNCGPITVRVRDDASLAAFVDIASNCFIAASVDLVRQTE